MQQFDLHNIHTIIVHHRAIVLPEVSVVPVPDDQRRLYAAHRCLLQNRKFTILGHLNLVAAVAPRNVTSLGHRERSALQPQGVATGAVLLARRIDVRCLLNVDVCIGFDLRVTCNTGLAVVAAGCFVGDGDPELAIAADDTRMMVELKVIQIKKIIKL